MSAPRSQDKPPAAAEPGTTRPGSRRKYHSPVRAQQMAETREKIIAAGAELVYSLPTWDWKNLTARAVGKRAGVSERTVHRHFASERILREAVVQRLIAESGVDVANLSVDTFATTAANTFTHLSSYAVSTEPTRDPVQTNIDEERKRALAEAVAEKVPSWSRREQELAASMLDLFWHPPTIERLKSGYHLDAAEAERAMTWLIGLVTKALEEDVRP